jgi:predicted Zn-dependent protease
VSEISLPDAVEIALELLGKDGGVVIGGNSATNNLRWANSALTTNGDSVDQTLSISAFVSVAGGVATGMSSGQIRSRADIEALVEASKASAISAGPAVDAMDLVQGPNHADFSESALVLDVSEISHISSGLSDVFVHRDQEFFGYAEQSLDTTYVGTSSGTRMRYSERTSRFELCAKSSDRKRSAWSGQGGTSLNQVSVQDHLVDVSQKLEIQLNQIDTDPGRHRVTLSPSAVSDLLIYMLWSSAARDAAEGRSAFSNTKGGTRVGEKLSDRKLTLATDPSLQGIETFDHVVNLGSSALGSAFDTGLKIGRSEIITGGVLTGLGSSRHAALEAKLPFTPLTDNISLVDDQGNGSLMELASRMGDGLLVTCLWYIREVDPQNLLLTGLTRDGVYLVSGGEIVGASNNFRFNESPIDMLSRVIDAGETVPCLPREWADWFSRARVAPLTIEGFNLSTKSDAV